MNEDTRKIDYVFFTVRELAYKVYATVINDLTDMLIGACPKDKRICVINFDHNDDDEDNDLAVFHEHSQLEYTTIKPDGNRASVQTAIIIGLVENCQEDKWHLIVDIPATRNHFEYDFWIEKDEDDDFDPNTAYRFGGTSRSKGVPETMDEYNAYKYYKQRIYDSIQNIIGNAHVAVRTDPDDPDAFVYR